MQPSPPSFLGQLLGAWQGAELRLRAAGVKVVTRIAEAGDKLVIELESASHLGLLEAWEHGCSLDFTCLELASRRSKVLFAGHVDLPGLPGRVALVEAALLQGAP
jgi:uncharacterized protein YmfQ (DUF2313 family)